MHPYPTARPSRPRARGFRILLLAIPWGIVSWSQGNAADTQPPSQALEQKQQEVERLQRELNQAQDELKQLKQENQRLRQQTTATPKTAKTAAPAKPAPPIATLPPLNANDLVDASDLVGHYQANPAAAAQRYEKKWIRVRGEIERFDTKLFIRTFDVLLVSPEPALSVVARFNYVDKYRSAYTKDRGRKLVATSAGNGQEFPLFELGQNVVLRCKCAGIRGQEVLLKDCEPVASQP